MNNNDEDESNVVEGSIVAVDGRPVGDEVQGETADRGITDMPAEAPQQTSAPQAPIPLMGKVSVDMVVLDVDVLEEIIKRVVRETILETMGLPTGRPQDSGNDDEN